MGNFFSLITTWLSCWHYFCAINLDSLYQVSWMLTLHLRIRYTLKKKKNQVSSQYTVDCYFHCWRSWLVITASWNVPFSGCITSMNWNASMPPMALKIKCEFQVWTLNDVDLAYLSNSISCHSPNVHLTSATDYLTV